MQFHSSHPIKLHLVEQNEPIYELQNNGIEKVKLFWAKSFITPNRPSVILTALNIYANVLVLSVVELRERVAIAKFGYYHPNPLPSPLTVCGDVSA